MKTDSDGVYVACGEAVLRLEVLQRDGGKPLPWREFRNGYSIQTSEHLSSL